MNHISDQKLKRQHTEEAIRKRINNKGGHGSLGDFVLGAVDGTITTFAIVSGVAGTGMKGGVAVAFVLGLANVIADGFSMGASNFLKARSDRHTLDHYRAMEEMHIDRIPEGEREELRHIYELKGFSGHILDEIVETITQDKKLFVDTMLTEEWGLHLSPPSALRAGLVTFAAFVAAGMLPLLPLLLAFNSAFSSNTIFLYSAVVTALTFLATGALQGHILKRSKIITALETLAVGSTAALIAYAIGEFLSNLLV